MDFEIYIYMIIYIYDYICGICANTSSLNKKDGGNVATQEVEAHPVCHFYLAKPCQQATVCQSFETEKESYLKRMVHLFPILT